MRDLSLIEEYYQSNIFKLNELVREGIYYVNINLLHELNLLNFQPLRKHKDHPLMDKCFFALKTSEKITLVNDEFIIWIVSNTFHDVRMTYTIIALNAENEDPRLEAIFVAKGIYNTTELILKVLEKFILEISETENQLSKYVQ